MRISSLLCHSFAPDLLDTATVALDCGANRGEFARWLSENTPAQVHSFEPDPRIFGSLPALPRVNFYPLAIDGESGEFELALGNANCSSALYRECVTQPTVRVCKTSLDDFCVSQNIEKIDFIKIDIEGAELSLLEKTSDSLLRNTTQMTVEFHDFLRREDRPRIIGIFQRMRSLGFYGIKFSYFTWGDCLFLNKRVVPLSMVDKMSIHLNGRLIPGLSRFVGRHTDGRTSRTIRSG